MQPLSISDPLWKAALFQESPIPVAFMDSAGRFSAVNSEFAQLVGYAGHELTKLHWHEITDPRDVDGHDRSLQSLMSHEDVQFCMLR